MFESQHYEHIQEIFHGENSVTVWCCNDKRSGKKVVVKTFPKEAFDSSFYQNELTITELAQGNNIIKLLDKFETQVSYNLVLEQGDCDLFDFICNNGPISEERFMRTFFGLTKALERLHNKNILHKDIKPENIVLIGSSLSFIDFGLSEIMSNVNQNNAFVGTTLFTAPEVVLNKVYTPSSDIYSFGIVMFFVLSGEVPFDCENSFQYVMNQINTPPDMASLLNRHISHRIISLIKKMLSTSPKDRPSISEVLATLWPQQQVGQDNNTSNHWE